MIEGFGAQRYYHFGVEAVKGEGIVGAGTMIPVTDFSLLQQWEVDQPSWFTGSGKRDFEIDRRYWVEGSITVPLYSTIYQAIIDLGYERELIADGFDMSNSWGILESSANEARHFKGLLSNRLSLSAAKDAPEVVVTHDMLGKLEAADTPFVRGALPPGKPFLFQCTQSEFFTADITALITSFEVNIENNLQLNDGPVDCSGAPYYTVGGMRTVNGSINVLYNSAAHRVAMRNRTEGSLVLELHNNSVTPEEVITITIPRFTLPQVPEDLDPETPTEESISFEAITDSSGDDIVVEYTTIP